MRRLIIAGTILALTVFGIGYAVGQIRAPASGFAASSGTNTFGHGSFMHAWSTRWRDRAAGTAGSMPRHADGTVTAINGDTFTVKPDGDTADSNEYTGVTTIQLSSSTQYGTGGKSAITVGTRIFAVGSVSADGKTLTATQVSAGRAGGCPHGTSPSTTTPGSGNSSTNA